MLHTSQPGISRQIQMLEAELGFDILARQGKRITGLTPEGETVLAAAQRMESEAERLRRLSKAHRNFMCGRLTVATTYFHARYTLVDAVLAYRKAHPDVSLSLHQSDPLEIARQVAAGEADLGISVESSQLEREVAFFPFDVSCRNAAQPAKRTLITPAGHPLLDTRRLTLALIAKYPMIMYDPKMNVGWGVMQTFKQNGIAPNVVLTASDADVIKTYVAAGLGVAIVQQPVIDPKRDRDLRAIDVSYLFEAGKTVLMLRRGNAMADHVGDFIRLVAPDLKPQMLQHALAL